MKPTGHSVRNNGSEALEYVYVVAQPPAKPRVLQVHEGGPGWEAQGQVDIPEATMEDKRIITCLQCSLEQFVAGRRCRRCKKFLCIADKPIQIAATPTEYVSTLPWPETLPTVAEAEADLLQEALRRSAGNFVID